MPRVRRGRRRINYSINPADYCVVHYDDGVGRTVTEPGVSPNQWMNDDSLERGELLILVLPSYHLRGRLVYETVPEIDHILSTLQWNGPIIHNNTEISWCTGSYYDGIPVERCTGVIFTCDIKRASLTTKQRLVKDITRTISRNMSRRRHRQGPFFVLVADDVSHPQPEATGIYYNNHGNFHFVHLT